MCNQRNAPKSSNTSWETFSIISPSQVLQFGNLDQYDQDFVLNYKFVSRGYANSTGDMLIVRPRVVGDQDTGMLNLFAEKKPRKYPIQFEEATHQDDIIDITLPAGYAADGIPAAGANRLRVRHLPQ